MIEEGTQSCDVDPWPPHTNEKKNRNKQTAATTPPPRIHTASRIYILLFNLSAYLYKGSCIPYWPRTKCVAEEDLKRTSERWN